GTSPNSILFNTKRPRAQKYLFVLLERQIEEKPLYAAIVLHESTLLNFKLSKYRLFYQCILLSSAYSKVSLVR
ncbi:unnamed protein product, partial [Tenebrio molitor]